MGALTTKIKDMPIRKAFILSVSITVVMILMLSAGTFAGLSAFQNFLLQDANAVYLTVTRTLEDGTQMESTIRMEYGEESQSVPFLTGGTTKDEPSNDTQYSVKKVDSGYSHLSPKRKFAYQGSGLAMVILPILYSVTGILICGFWFYRKKLEQPIHVLSDATEEISKQNLDFSIQYTGNDELGKLCNSFEQMRAALYENNRKMWELLEERRLLQASVGHDLRNPVAIIEGYTEYLLLNLPTGTLDDKKILDIAGNLNQAAKRMERYTDSIREISKLEEIEVKPVPTKARELLEDMAADFQMIAEQQDISITVSNSVPNTEINADASVLYRILENVISNALRYAKNEIHISFELNKNQLSAEITDDGPGFPEKFLLGKGRSPYTTDTTNQHLGIGLIISRILCQKHGGTLELYNKPEAGAFIKVTLQV